MIAAIGLSLALAATPCSSAAVPGESSEPGLAAVPAAAQTIDDSDLSGKPAPGRKVRLQAEWRLQRGALVFPLKPLPSPNASQARPGAVTGEVLLADAKGALRPARLASVALVGPGDKPAGAAAVGEDGRFELAIPGDARGAYLLRMSLDNKRWSFENPDAGRPYAWDSAPFQLPAPDGVRLGALSPEPGSGNAKAGLLHLTFLEALDALAKQRVGLEWWTKTLNVNWPDDGDYFSPWGFSLHLTEPHAWDVILHELGHAVMHLTMRAASAGGQHKIDECYNPALAWSEGWATFFAGVVHLDGADPDARFEFLVPRRAPIRLENVPEDVCRGQANEWRVASALWDLYDSHPDGLDALELPFARLWGAWAKRSMGSLSDYLGLLAPGLSPSELAGAKAALRQNAIEAPASAEPIQAPSALLATPAFE